jgi:hypothetical protein
LKDGALSCIILLYEEENFHDGHVWLSGVMLARSITSGDASPPEKTLAEASFFVVFIN